MRSNRWLLIFNKHFSIKQFLSLFLLLVVTLTILILGILNYYQLKRQNENLFKMQMVNSARVIDALLTMHLKESSLEKLSSLLRSSPVSTINNIKDNLKPQLVEFNNAYKDSFSFQVYNYKSGSVVLKSTGAPRKSINLREKSFSQLITLNKGIKSRWYVFSMKSHYKPYKINVLVNTHFKEQTFLSNFWKTIWNLLVLYALLSSATVFIVQLALRPIDKIRKALANRDPRKLEEIKVDVIPTEIIPILNELNQLFVKVNQVFDRERRFSGDAAHELKTPLAALKTQAEVALNVNSMEKVRTNIKNIIYSSNQYVRIIDQLLTLSRLDSAERLFTFNSVRVDSVIKELISDMAQFAINKNIDLEVFGVENPIFIMAEKTFICILFRNLLDNAIRYTTDGGKIVVKLKVTNNLLKVSVLDNGIGIPNEKLHRIFDRFYREKGTGATGSGLGLSIVKEIVTLHNGTIEAKSSEVTSGLEMIVNFPIRVSSKT